MTDYILLNSYFGKNYFPVLYWGSFIQPIVPVVAVIKHRSEYLSPLANSYLFDVLPTKPLVSPWIEKYHGNIHDYVLKKDKE